MFIRRCWLKITFPSLHHHCDGTTDIRSSNRNCPNMLPPAEPTYKFFDTRILFPLSSMNALPLALP